jgi:hypothetical protein
MSRVRPSHSLLTDPTGSMSRIGNIARLSPTLLRRVALVVIGLLVGATNAGVRLNSLADAALAGNMSDPAPPAAFAPLRLQSVQRWAKLRCRWSGVGLCPTALPRPILGPVLSTGSNGHPPPLQVQSRTYVDHGGRFAWISFSYGAPWEPDSGPGWQQHLWRNRPCCFLHFEVYRRLSGRPIIPENGRPTTLSGKRGYLAQPASSGTFCGNGNRGVYWCNHLRFVWKQDNSWYAASLHWFGRGTRGLLADLVRTLR